MLDWWAIQFAHVALLSRNSMSSGLGATKVNEGPIVGTHHGSPMILSALPSASSVRIELLFLESEGLDSKSHKVPTTSVPDVLIMEGGADVLIVGAGPSGLMLANWLARCNVSFRIIDKKPNQTLSGHADGLQCRTLEVIESFGFIDQILKIANPLVEVCLWGPSPDGHIQRNYRLANTAKGVSYIEKIFSEELKRVSGVSVERSIEPISLQIDRETIHDPHSKPIHVQLMHRRADGSIYNEDIQVKYLIGCDGAHSWVRRTLGIPMIGESSESVWGVVDTMCVSDFPDIRCCCTVQSSASGTLKIIPREKGIVRFYVQLRQYSPVADTMDRSSVTSSEIIEAARNILKPYSLVVHREMIGQTVYRVGQRLAPRFSSFNNRVLLSGDACHSHSPKVGQGMNVSMMDAYNLGWKIAQTLNGTITSSVLDTYEYERRKIAEDLLDLDRKIAPLISQKISPEDAVESTRNLRKVFKSGKVFMSGVGVIYGPSMLTIDHSDALHLARHVHPGRRIDSHQVLCQADARPWNVHELMPSDGRWRIVILAGDVREVEQMEKINRLGSLFNGENGLVTNVTPRECRLDSVVQVLTIHRSPRKEVELVHFPSTLCPPFDYEKIFVDDESYLKGHGQAYEGFGVHLHGESIT
ncbi:hypothetical protein PROFUN_13178 [Planoprotostelium fungivorum]|uniref:FAD-binding domain-containing protein n=1 Tax=Planoprotostelium fungivorum TaxID=1890364 RepID=A0A2P6N547_9EUKA|nr:hypothetical protein PROFUN_13178 [Planoprotostelium fungivorum]